MGMADSDRGGSGAGRGGVGGGGSAGGGGFDGRDTPGSPNAPDGKRGSTMGPDGGRATGGGPGRDTPGAPSNPGRRGQHEAGSTPASRARDAMSRHQRESRERDRESGGLVAGELGIGKEYSHADAIAERAKTGAVSPREADIARGYASGKSAAMAEQSVGSMAGDTLSRATGLPGVGSAVSAGVGELAEGRLSSPESRYGAAVGRERASNTGVQSVAELGASVFGGPVAGVATGLINTAINDQRTRDISRMSQAMGLQAPGSTAATRAVSGGKAQSAIAAMSGSSGGGATRPPGRAFGWSPVDIDRYRRNPMNLARNS